MINSSRYRKIKTLQDIRVEKARLRYEALVAENAMMEGFRSVERAFTMFSMVRRVSEYVGHGIRAVSGIARFFGRVFHKKPHQGASQPETEASENEDTVRF